jgi:hypothetical protein
VDDRFISFLKLFSGLFGLSLSETEMKVLNEFYWGHAGKINAESRRQVCKRLGMTVYSLNNHLHNLRQRNVVNGKGFNHLININVMPQERSFKVEFNLKTA